MIIKNKNNEIVAKTLANPLLDCLAEIKRCLPNRSPAINGMIYLAAYMQLKPKEQELIDNIFNATFARG